MASQPELLDRRVYHPGETIFKEGDMGRRSAFLVESGKVEISKGSTAGNKVLGFVQQGGIFGEMALVDQAPRMATAKAVEDTTVVIISESMLEAKLRKTDPFIRGLFSIFVRTIRELTTKVLEQQKVQV